MTLLVKGKHPPYLTSIVVVGKLIARKYLVMDQGWEETNNILTSVLTSAKAVSAVPSGGNKTDVCRENTDVRWVGFPHS
jgi:hypothetical protein